MALCLHPSPVTRPFCCSGIHLVPIQAGRQHHCFAGWFLLVSLSACLLHPTCISWHTKTKQLSHVFVHCKAFSQLLVFRLIRLPLFPTPHHNLRLTYFASLTHIQLYISLTPSILFIHTYKHTHSCTSPFPIVFIPVMHSLASPTAGYSYNSDTRCKPPLPLTNPTFPN